MRLRCETLSTCIAIISLYSHFPSHFNGLQSSNIFVNSKNTFLISNFFLSINHCQVRFSYVWIFDSNITIPASAAVYILLDHFWIYLVGGIFVGGKSIQMKTDSPRGGYRANGKGHKSVTYRKHVIQIDLSFWTIIMGFCILNTIFTNASYKPYKHNYLTDLTNTIHLWYVKTGPRMLVYTPLELCGHFRCLQVLYSK